MNFGIIVLLHNVGKLAAWLLACTHNIPNYHGFIFPAECEKTTTLHHYFYFAALTVVKQRRLTLSQQ